ncbi:MAG: rod shape-determining protein MreC [Rhodospirillaceae bacterium]|nr:rod shape-determining protein MreC [Rhodospirillaceae bacterium]
MTDRIRTIHATTPHSGHDVGDRILNVILIGASLAMLAVGKANPEMMEGVRSNISDVATPILETLARPISSTEKVISEIGTISEIRNENENLRSENERLLQWQSAARKLEIENRQLKGLLNFAPGAEPGFVTASVIADTGGSFVRSILASAGSRNGVTKGNAVITSEGLVGRVQGVGSRSARILLITDLNSRIPVVIESTRTRAIMAGDNSDRPKLIHLPPGATVSPGDRVVTSGHGGAFPPGIQIGIVTSVDEKGIFLQPFVQRERIEFVRIVDYGLKGILDADSAAEGAGINKQ